MRYIYPANIYKEDEKFLIDVPNLKGCHTFGDSLVDAIQMARDAMAMWLCEAENNNEEIPQATNYMDNKQGLISLIDVDTLEYRRINDNRAMNKTLTLPRWLNEKAEKAGINFSQTLQEAIKHKLDI